MAGGWPIEKGCGAPALVWREISSSGRLSYVLVLFTDHPTFFPHIRGIRRTRNASGDRMSLQMYKELYTEESQRENQLQSSVGTPISIVTVLGGGLLLMGKAFESSHPVAFVPFWIALAVGLCCFAATAYCIIRSVHGYVYERIPHASQLIIHHANLKAFHSSAGTLESAQAAFEAYLIRMYVAATDRNAANNLNRGAWLNEANRWLVYALCSTAVAGIPAAIQIKTAPEKAQKIEITNLRSFSDVGGHSPFGVARPVGCPDVTAGFGWVPAGRGSAGRAP